MNFRLAPVSSLFGILIESKGISVITEIFRVKKQTESKKTQRYFDVEIADFIRLPK